MEREIYAKIIVDDDRAIAEDKRTLDYFETEFGWLNDSGIALEHSAVLDDNSTDEWERYCKYLFEWTINHLSDDNKGMSPACFDEWRDNEDAVQKSSYTAIIYEDNGIIGADLSTYHSAEEAVNFAKSRGWDEVVDDITGKIIYRRK